MTYALTKSAAVAAAMVASLLAAGSAGANDQFNGCHEIHWSTLGEAVAANDAGLLTQFLEMHGPACEPLRVTAVALLCDLDPAACVVTVEPAAGEPEPGPEDEILEYMILMSDFAYRAPGQHIGTENSRNDAGTAGSTGGSAPSAPSTPSYSPPSPDR